MNVVHALPAEEGTPKVSYTAFFKRLQKLEEFTQKNGDWISPRSTHLFALYFPCFSHFRQWIAFTDLFPFVEHCRHIVAMSSAIFVKCMR